MSSYSPARDEARSVSHAPRSNSESQRVSADPGTTRRQSEVPVSEEHSDSESEEEFRRLHEWASSWGFRGTNSHAPENFLSSSRTEVHHR